MWTARWRAWSARTPRTLATLPSRTHPFCCCLWLHHTHSLSIPPPPTHRSAKLRRVEVAADSLKVGGLPRTSHATTEAVVSALAADALPPDVLARIHGIAMNVGKAADSVALRDTGMPIVSSFGKGAASTTHRG